VAYFFNKNFCWISKFKHSIFSLGHITNLAHSEKCECESECEKKERGDRFRSHSRSFLCGPSWDPRLTDVSRAGNQRPPDYERLMRVSMDLHRFVSLCTSSFCNRIIVKDFRILYQFGQILAPKLALLSLCFW
jgi:hypothetical protein